MEEFVHELPGNHYPGFVPRLESHGETFATVSYADPSIRGFATAEANPSRLVSAGVGGEYRVTFRYRDYARIDAEAIWEDDITITGTGLPRDLALRLNFHFSGTIPNTVGADPDGNGQILVGIQARDTRFGGPFAGINATFAAGEVTSTTLGTGVDSLTLTAQSIDIGFHLDLRFVVNPEGTTATGSFSDIVGLYFTAPSVFLPGEVLDPL